MLWTTLQNTPHMRYLKMWLGRRLSASQVPETPDPPVAESSQSSRKQPSSPTGPPPVPRDYDVRDLAEKRDKNICVLTKMDEPLEGCHIFPYSIGQNSKNDKIQFWGRLKNFWSREKVAAWQQDILSDRGTEVCQNLLTFNTLAHDLWGLARFGLEPVEVSEDRKTLTSGPGKSLMADCETVTFIRSGHVITMTTEDPETMPLPSLELLGMHWGLTRVAALAGAAEATDVEFNEESDEDFGDFRIIER
ncbi:hypothetical protein ATERTT37_002279 [Aspergillus terreus]